MKYQPVHSDTTAAQSYLAAEAAAAQLAARRLAYWRSTRRLTGALLACWFLISFPMIFFARQLSGVVLFGWPLSFYVAAQGASLVYVAIIGLYAWRMRRLDREFGQQEQLEQPGQQGQKAHDER